MFLKNSFMIFVNCCIYFKLNLENDSVAVERPRSNTKTKIKIIVENFMSEL